MESKINKGNSLNPLLSRGITVVFVGTKPGKKSIRIGHYYAGKGNSFYLDLYETNWTQRELDPQEDEMLLKEGVGLDDVYSDPASLKERLSKYRPKVVCFNSKSALESFIGRRLRRNWMGENASSYLRLDWKPLIWALPDSSAIARGYHRKRIELLKELLKRLRQYK